MTTLWHSLDNVRKIILMNLLLGYFELAVYLMSYLTTYNQITSFSIMSVAVGLTFVAVMTTVEIAATVMDSVVIAAFAGLGIIIVAVSIATSDVSQINIMVTINAIAIVVVATVAVAFLVAREYCIKHWLTLLIFSLPTIMSFSAMTLSSKMSVILLNFYWITIVSLCLESSLKKFIKSNPLPAPVLNQEKIVTGFSPYRITEVIVDHGFVPESLSWRARRFLWRLYS